MKNSRILSLNLGGLGDLITTLPVLSALSNAGASITSLVWPALEELALCIPCIDTVLGLTRQQENDPQLSELISGLAGTRGFDLVLDFAFPPRAGIITRAAGGRRTLGFNIDREACPWYTANFPNLPDEHRLERNLKLLDYLGFERPAVPDFPMTFSGRALARLEDLLEYHGLCLRRDRPIALHPGSGVSKRNWPAERFAALADRLAAHTGRRVLLLGGRGRTYDGTDESELVRRVQAAMQTAPVNLAGELSLPELACLLRYCSLFVGNNSGPAHLAATIARTPALLVWAPRNEKIWRPVGPKVELLFAETFCRDDCLLNRCDNIQYCLNLIPVEEVFERYLSAFAAGGQYTQAAGERR
ncbi:MAG: hypothetical protein A2Z86_01300 [Candidatus Glassbacteria bacterium GWA2_58_10]|uniref:Glycosyltransferase family 9 protein n=1 Tax=Candidatus Glassbacteria bacterium GWA2_58_10 TaxID=1817865 RepID=A0A1F5YE08_9BACT|nr:MAG: hypothetical protein A2Z86_01300 [Candidatus Glassbacteria bacterium GWA2_58_10]